MKIAKKVRLYPNTEQEHLMWKSAGTARFIYNWTLNREQESYKNGTGFISDNEIRKEITQLKKKDLSWLYEVNNNVTKQAVKDCCKAYKNFFKNKSKFPKFKSRKKSKPSFYNDTAKLKISEMKVQLETIGEMPTGEQLPMNVKIYNPRVTHDGFNWFLSISYDTEFEKTDLTDNSIGIDIGIKNLAICSNGKVYKNINKTKKVKKLKKKLKREQRKLSRMLIKNTDHYEMKVSKKDNKEYQVPVYKKDLKECKNIQKQERIIKLIYRKLTNIRNNHLHQTTTEIVKTKPSRIVVEDLNVTGMMKNKHLSKAIQEQKFYEFKRQLIYKSEKTGIQVVQADRFYPSSKKCSKCGYIKKDLKLKDRVFKCPYCRNTIDRDLNASINLANYIETN